MRACAQILINNPIEENSVVDYLISSFNLYDVRNTLANQLSGGQIRRLVIALSLIGNKRIILLDEPFSHLDPQAILMLQKIIVNLPTQDKQRRSLLVTDHQPKALLAVCDKAMILSNTKIVASGSKNTLLKSKDAIDAYFGDAFSNL
jgi:lipopolysaccharide export system ATP-binding protein